MGCDTPDMYWRGIFTPGPVFETVGYVIRWRCITGELGAYYECAGRQIGGVWALEKHCAQVFKTKDDAQRRARQLTDLSPVVGRAIVVRRVRPDPKEYVIRKRHPQQFTKAEAYRQIDQNVPGFFRGGRVEWKVCRVRTTGG